MNTAPRSTVCRIVKNRSVVFSFALALDSSILPIAMRSDTPASKPDVSRIYGKIQYVDSFPDYKGEVVSSFEDLSVQEVAAFADGPSKWQIVDSFPDFKIQKASSFGDFKVRYVTAFPGTH